MVKYGLKNGFGIEIRPFDEKHNVNEIYVGEWKNNTRHGVGILFDVVHNISHIGKFENGLFQRNKGL
jgi:MORN repeat protein